MYDVAPADFKINVKADNLNPTHQTVQSSTKMISQSIALLTLLFDTPIVLALSYKDQ